MIISIVVAVAENQVIGANNKLLWRLSEDLKKFKKITTGHTIIMGRKTYESIGKPLPNRENIVITHNKSYKVDQTKIFHSIDDALDYCRNEQKDEVFIIGGGQIYHESLVFADKLYYTKVKTSIKGDTYFPAVNLNDWEILSQESFFKNEKNEYAFDFFELKRKNNLA